MYVQGMYRIAYTLPHTVPTKSLETTCHFPITLYYNTMSYQIKKTPMHFQTL